MSTIPSNRIDALLEDFVIFLQGAAKMAKHSDDALFFRAGAVRAERVLELVQEQQARALDTWVDGLNTIAEELRGELEQLYESPRR